MPVTNAPAPTIPSTYDEGGAMVALRKQLEQRAEEFRMVLPDHITPQKFQRTLLTAVQVNPDLLGCDRRSFLTACMKSAQDGLLPDGRDAAIVPFKTRTKDPQRGWIEVRLAQYLPMVAGLMKKVRQSGEVSDIRVKLVYRQEIERGLFIYEEGATPVLRHRPMLDPDFVPSDDDIAAAYSVATYRDGGQSVEVMSRADIDRVREASQSGARFDAKGEPREPKGPWRDWFPEMAKKTVIRRHAKTLPQSGDIVIRDVEAEDMGLGAAKSALALLGSRPPEEPRPLLGEGEPREQLADPPQSETVDEAKLDERRPRTLPDAPSATSGTFDPETGEIKTDPEPVQTKPKPKPKPAPEPDPEPEPDHPEPDPFEPFPVETEPNPNYREPTINEADFAEAAEFERDELGITKEPDEAKAEALIQRAKRCEFLLDLKALQKEAEMDLAAMRPEIAACVDTEFAMARKRLNPRANDKAS